MKNFDEIDNKIKKYLDELVEYKLITYDPVIDRYKYIDAIICYTKIELTNMAMFYLVFSSGLSVAMTTDLTGNKIVKAIINLYNDGIAHKFKSC